MKAYDYTSLLQLPNRIESKNCGSYQNIIILLRHQDRYDITFIQLLDFWYSFGVILCPHLTHYKINF